MANGLRVVFVVAALAMDCLRGAHSHGNNCTFSLGTRLGTKFTKKGNEKG